MNYFVTSIHTDSGKTLVSAILCQALGADYWKPVQAGFPTDSSVIKKLVTNPNTLIHPEGYLLNHPQSPHAAAKLDNLSIAIDHFKLPLVNKKDLIVEGAGGCLVPLNDHEVIIDLAIHFHMTVILVANLYLGSINHTLLTLEALRHRKVQLKGIIFNGPGNPESERIILLHAGCNCLLKINTQQIINCDIIKNYATDLMEHWND